MLILLEQLLDRRVALDDPIVPAAEVQRGLGRQAALLGDLLSEIRNFKISAAEEFQFFHIFEFGGWMGFEDDWHFVRVHFAQLLEFAGLRGGVPVAEGDFLDGGWVLVFHL